MARAVIMEPSSDSSPVVSKRLVILGTLILITIFVGVPYILLKDKADPSSAEERSKFKSFLGLDWNDNMYTRGEVNYLNMDSGMGPCWNRTLKPLLALTCPSYIQIPGVELELSFMIASCYCESIGKGPLYCPALHYHDSERKIETASKLLKCSIGMCLNEFGNDGFQMIHKRMPALCYYYMDESQRTPSMIPKIDVGVLNHLKSSVSGGPSHNGPFLEHLYNIVLDETESRRNRLTEWFHDSWEEVLLIFDDILFKLRIGKYSGVPYY